MRKYIDRIVAFMAILLFGCFTFLSCKKNGPTVGVVSVLDTLGKPVSAATVILWQDTSHSTQTGLQSALRKTGTSDVNGKASFEFDQEAYLNIYAIKNKDTATGIIQLKQHETVTQIVQF